MQWRIEDGPAYSTLVVKLNPGETIAAEPGAMLLVKGNVDVKTTSGGLMKGLLRKIGGGESVFINYYTARSGDAEIWFAPSLPGDIKAIELHGDAWVLHDRSYLAHSGSIDLSVAWRGFRGLLTQGELVWLKASGTGTLWVNSFGAIKEVRVEANQRIIIDNMHFVAMPANTRYTIRKFGGLKTFILGGEGIVVEIYGPARVYVQTRNLPALAGELLRFRQ